MKKTKYSFKKKKQTQIFNLIPLFTSGTPFEDRIKLSKHPTKYSSLNDLNMMCIVNQISCSLLHGLTEKKILQDGFLRSTTRYHREKKMESHTG